MAAKKMIGKKLGGVRKRVTKTVKGNAPLLRGKKKVAAKKRTTRRRIANE